MFLHLPHLSWHVRLGLSSDQTNGSCVISGTIRTANDSLTETVGCVVWLFCRGGFDYRTGLHCANRTREQSFRNCTDYLPRIQQSLSSTAGTFVLCGWLSIGDLRTLHRTVCRIYSNAFSLPAYGLFEAHFHSSTKVANPRGHATRNRLRR